MIVYLSSIEVLGLLGFIITSRYHGGMVTRYIPLLLVLATTALIAYVKAKEFTSQEIICISVGASTISILMVQVLGFTVYPGLAKGLVFLSVDNLIRTGVVLSLGIVGHCTLLFLGKVGQLRG